MDKGEWIILENSHLSQRLTKHFCIHYQNAIKIKNIHDEFRMWFVTNSSSQLPIEMLRHSIKLCTNTSNNIPEHIQYLNKKLKNCEINDESDSKQELSQHQQKIICRLKKFHAVISERCGYHSIGWTEKYLFSSNDCINIISNMNLIFQNNQKIAYEMVEGLVLECYFNGIVWKSMDRILLKTLFLDIFFNETNNDDEYNTFSYLNSNVKFLQNEKNGKNFIASVGVATGIMKIHRMEGNDNYSKSNADIVLMKCKEISNKLPTTLKCPIIGENESIYEPILKNEFVRFNKLLHFVRKCLNELQNILIGALDMTIEMEQFFMEILENRFPMQWFCYSYPTRKSFASYISDLGQRIDFLQSFKRNRTPCAIWFSAFFHPQSLLTAIRRQFSQFNGVRFDDVIVNYTVVDTSKVCFVVSQHEKYCISV